MPDLIFDPRLREHIRAHLNHFERRVHEMDATTNAAVAVTIVDYREDPHIDGLAFSPASNRQAAVILTRRAATLKHHAGQWALPGGRMEDGERAVDTVLRELAEEVGVHLSETAVIGRLDDYSTRSGFTIKPVVLWGGTDYRLRPNPAEVASIHLIPLAEFMRPDAPILEPIPESDHPVLKMPVGHGFIASPTAAILYQFREVALCGRSRRVAHYEQPYFAWH